MYAIVVTGGKQYKVEQGDTIEVEKLSGGPGEQTALDVVFLADGSTIITEREQLATAKVFATIVEQFKGTKQLIFKFKKRKGYKRFKGHRQMLTRLAIDAISPEGTPPKAPSKDAKLKQHSTTVKTAARSRSAVAGKNTKTEEDIKAKRVKSSAQAQETTADAKATASERTAQSTKSTKVEKATTAAKTTRTSRTAKVTPDDTGAQLSSTTRAVTPKKSDKDTTQKTPAKKPARKTSAATTKKAAPDADARSAKTTKETDE
jgi:large subunit ribosomal protein L21